MAIVAQFSNVIQYDSIFFYSYLQMNDELRIQMAYLLRNYSVGTMNRFWMYLFSEVNNASMYNAIVY